MRIELFTAPGCPNAAAARTVLADCLEVLGIHDPIIERVGRYRSPTVCIDGIDVMSPRTGSPIGDECRLDLPTGERVLSALKAGTRVD